MTMAAILVLATVALAGLAGAGCSGGSLADHDHGHAAHHLEAQSETSETTPVTYVTVEVQQAFDALSADEDSQIVDVREPERMGRPPASRLERS